MRKDFEIKYEGKTYYIHTYEKENIKDSMSVIFPEKDNCSSIGGMDGVIFTPETALIWLDGYTLGIETGISNGISEIEDKLTELKSKYYDEFTEKYDDFFDEDRDY